MGNIVKSKPLKILLIGILILFAPLLIYCMDILLEFIFELGRFVGTIIVNIAVNGIC